MAHLLYISDKTKRAGQEVDDFVLAYDFEPTENEKELFTYVPAPNVTAEEIMASLEKLKEKDKEYPKFPFSKVDLTTNDVEDIESPAVSKETTIALIDKMKLKKPTTEVAEIQ